MLGSSASRTDDKSPADDFATRWQKGVAEHRRDIKRFRRIAEEASPGCWGEDEIVERVRELQVERLDQLAEELYSDPDYRREMAEVGAELREQRRQEQLDAYYASPQAEADWQEYKRAKREYREKQIKEAFRVRADELAGMAFPAERTASRSRERRDTASRSSSRRGESGDEPPPDDPDEIAGRAAA
jgi:hypothetical protein